MFDKTFNACFPTRPGYWLAALLVVAGCESSAPAEMLFSQPGHVKHDKLVEISGLQASRDREGLFWVHNDDGKPRVWAIDETGADLGHFDIEGATNRDWEDIALIPREDQDLLVLADTGDNSQKQNFVMLYVVAEPAPDTDGRVRGDYPSINSVKIRYPDGAHDCEAVAWDEAGQQLLLLTKRDLPSRLYRLGVEQLLGETEATLEFLGEVDSFRAPTSQDRGLFGNRSKWVSQPTGMDIAPDGSQAAIISYRSLYLFDLVASGDWLESLRASPGEIYGPPSKHEEAVSYSTDGQSLYVIPEGRYPPVYRFDFVAEPAEVLP